MCLARHTSLQHVPDFEASAPQTLADYRLCPVPNCGYITAKGSSAYKHYRRAHELRSAAPSAASGGAAATAAPSHSGDDVRDGVLADDSDVPVDPLLDAGHPDVDRRDSDDESAKSASDSDAGHGSPLAFDYGAWRSVRPMGQGRLLPVDSETGAVLYGRFSSKCWEPDCFVYCESYNDLHKHCEDVHDYFPPTTRQFKTLDELDKFIRTVATEGDLVKVAGGMAGPQEWRCPLNGRPHMVRRVF